MSSNRQVRYPIRKLFVINPGPGWRAFIALFVFFVISTAFSIHTFLTVVPPSGSCTTKMGSLSPQLMPAPAGATEEKIETASLKISQHYGVDQKLAKDVVALAKAYEDRTFPKAADIIAIVAIESTFNPKAENAGAYGIMQIQYGHHKGRFNSPRDLMDPVYNIRAGVQILKEYNQALRGNKEATILAYQAGIGGYLEGDTKQDYLRKYQHEVAWLQTVI